VVGVNFINRKNATDHHLFRLLSEKFHLFEGVFGASDEVLGAIGSGVDFEKRIHDIYQRCRKADEIRHAFEQLQLELSFEIDERMTQAQRNLLENFDEEVREKLRMRDAASRAFLDRYERTLMRITRHELGAAAEWASDSSFLLRERPFPGEFELGLYELPRRSGEAYLYRLGHPLAEAIIERARSRELEHAEIHLSYRDHGGKISSIEPLVGRTGYLRAALLTVESLEQAEDYILIAGVLDSGEILDDDVSRRLLSLPGRETGSVSDLPSETLSQLIDGRRDRILEEITARNHRFFDAEVEKLYAWAEDLKTALERDLKELERLLREAQRATRSGISLEEKLALQKRVKELEAQKREKRRALFDAQDEVDRRRDALIEATEAKLQQNSSTQELFSVRWTLT